MSIRERDLGSNPHSVTGLPDIRELLSKRMAFGQVIPGRRDSIPQKLGRNEVDLSRYTDRPNKVKRRGRPRTFRWIIYNLAASHKKKSNRSWHRLARICLVEEYKKNPNACAHRLRMGAKRAEQDPRRG